MANAFIWFAGPNS